VHFPAVTLAAALVLSSGMAQAQATAVPEALFREGKKLLEEGRYVETCPKFAESERLDPSSGTLLALALCHEKLGRTASAWAEFNEVVTLARKQAREDRVTVAREHAAALEPTLSYLTIHTADVGTALQLSLDGQMLGAAAVGVRTPVDPGEHEIGASAAGKRPWKESVTVGAAHDDKTIEVPSLEDAPAPPANPPPSNQVPTANVDAGEPVAAGSFTRTAGIAAIGVGIVGIGVGGFFGVRAFSRWSDRNDGCPTSTTCTHDGKIAGDDAQSAATISTIAFAAGAALSAVGVYLVLTSRSGARRAVTAAPWVSGARGMSIGADF